MPADFNDIAKLLTKNELSVGTSPTEVKVGASSAAGREYVAIYNDSSNIVYVGDSSVTTSGAKRGRPIEKRQWAHIPSPEDGPVYLIADQVSSVQIEEWGNG